MPKIAQEVVAIGRHLVELLPLTRAEEQLQSACRNGQIARIGFRRPEASRKMGTASALRSFRVFCLGTDPDAPVHEHGVHIEGAWIEGDIDLEGMKIKYLLAITNCRVDGKINLRDVVSRTISFFGTHCEAIDGDRLKCSGSLILRNDFISDNYVRLLGAKIGSNFECDGGIFNSDGEISLNCDQMSVKGSVMLRYGFIANGIVSFINSSIGRNFECDNGRFMAKSNISLILDNIKTGGNVFFRSGFQANGEIRLNGSTISGDLALNDSLLAHETMSLTIERANIFGSLWLYPIYGKHLTINMASSNLYDIIDNQQDWTGFNSYIGRRFIQAPSQILPKPPPQLASVGSTANHRATSTTTSALSPGKNARGSSPRWGHEQESEPDPDREATADALASLEARDERSRTGRDAPGDRLRLDPRQDHRLRLGAEASALLAFRSVGSPPVSATQPLPPGVMAPADALVYFSPRISTGMQNRLESTCSHALRTSMTPVKSKPPMPSSYPA